MKLISWNVNGIRAAIRHGLLDWMRTVDADAYCLQETKMSGDDLFAAVEAPEGYTAIWHPARKAGYSGVATFTRMKPLSASDMGIAEFDDEGRVQALEFADFFLVNAYWPNTRRDHSRLPYKLSFCKAIAEFCNARRASGKHVVICGDYNIAHEEIDIARPKQNIDNAGFLPEERAAMTDFLGHGYVDTFRHFNKEPGNYTWWAYFANARAKNIGWRIDYFCVDRKFIGRVKESTILSDVKGSDHCPIQLVVEGKK